MKIASSSLNIILNIVIGLLVFVGIISIYSSTYTALTPSEGKGKLSSQLIILIIGFIIFVLVSKFDYSYFRLFPVITIIYVLTISLLVFVLLQTDENRGTNRWINLGFFNIQPAEYAKITIILINSIIFSIKKDSFIEFKNKICSRISILGLIDDKTKLLSNHAFSLFILSFLLNLPILILVFKQPSLGNTLIILFIWLAMFFFLVGNQLKYILYGIFVLLGINLTLNIIPLNIFRIININIGSDITINLVALLISIVFIVILALFIRFGVIKGFIFLFIGAFLGLMPAFIWENTLDYQKQRIESFINPTSEKSSDRWQIEQSKIAIGSGEVMGKGFLKGSQSKLKYLPFAYTDFIFASLSEEFGFVGSLFVLFLFLTLLISLLYSYGKVSDPFGSSIIIGVFLMILLHVFVNIGMNIGILPVTGIPLPFISYGGSSILVNLISLAIVQNVITKSNSVDTNRQTVITSDSLFGIRSY